MVFILSDASATKVSLAISVRLFSVTRPPVSVLIHFASSPPEDHYVTVKMDERDPTVNCWSMSCSQRFFDYHIANSGVKSILGQPAGMLHSVRIHTTMEGVMR